MTRADIEQFIEDHGYEDLELLLCDGMEEAFIGVSQCFNRFAAVYDYDRCIAILMERDDMDYESAVEYMEFNVTGAYVGEATPVFILAHINEPGPWGPS